MSERQHNEEEYDGPQLSFDADGIHFELRPDNTGLFLHEDERYDHFIHNRRGSMWRIWRKQMDNFDEVVDFMQETGFPVEAKDVPDREAREMFHRTFPDEEIVRTHELTDHEEKQVLFARWLLEHEYITPESFA